ncbi:MULTISPECIES: hypothetical protein [Burkholderia]|uniref:hypothetical protein n=1 Tax=Burkholderia TaxID=32008 RepID=UPI000F5FC2DC|nr:MULTISPECIES: hypothetical protein [Burkholderia]MBY4866692.1 hypothetical protein [Burkholderia anthina]
MREMDGLRHAHPVLAEQRIEQRCLIGRTPRQQPFRIHEVVQRAAVLLRMAASPDDGRLRRKERHVVELGARPVERKTRWRAVSL